MNVGANRSRLGTRYFNSTPVIPMEFQIRDTAQRGGAATKSSSSSTARFTITRTTTRRRDSRGLRRFGQILIECNSALRSEAIGLFREQLLTVHRVILAPVFQSFHATPGSTAGVH